jgi:uncharacterized protein YpiB (UPF0302 family)
MERRVVKNQMYSLIAEMLLEKAVHDFKKRQIYEQIDDALDARDKRKFNRLTKQLRELLEKEQKEKAVG